MTATATATRKQKTASTPKNGAKGRWVTCDMIYFEQNRQFHALFGAVGLSYNRAADKETILGHIQGALGKRVTLSKLCLGDRLKLIRHLAKAWSLKAVTIGVPRRLRAWRKGDPPKGYARKEIPASSPHARIKRYILGMWLDLGYEPARVDERVKRQFGTERLEWVNDENALQTLAKDLYSRCAKAGLDPEPHA